MSMMSRKSPAAAMMRKFTRDAKVVNKERQSTSSSDLKTAVCQELVMSVWADVDVLGGGNISRRSSLAKSKFPPRTHLFPLTLFKTHLRHTATSIFFGTMAPSRSYSRLAWLLVLLAMFSMLCPTSAVYFYLDGTTPKCFYEELPKDTLVVGT